MSVLVTFIQDRVLEAMPLQAIIFAIETQIDSEHPTLEPLTEILGEGAKNLHIGPFAGEKLISN